MRRNIKYTAFTFEWKPVKVLKIQINAFKLTQGEA